MPVFLSHRASLMKPSPILALAAKANEMKASGLDVISLTVGEPDWETFGHVKEAAIASIRAAGKGKYTPSNGIAELRAAIAAQVSEDLGLQYGPADVTCSAGAKFVLFSALQALCDPGDEVVIQAPFWASYTTMIELAGAKPRIAVCDAATEFKLTPAILAKSIGLKTKVFLFNSPSNPTGKVYTRKELEGLASVLKDHPRVVTISDDIYNRLIFDGARVAPHILHAAPELRDRVLALNGASKTYAMTGWRLGWAVGPRELVQAMTNYQSQSVSCPTAVSQYAALDAVKNGDPEVKKTVEMLKQRRDFIIGELAKVDGICAHRPDGAFYVWIDVSAFLGKKTKSGKALATTGDLAAALLEEQLVAIVPGFEFGLEGFVRLSFALQNDKAKQAVERMGAFFRSLS
jgi:aspartate aminotransferase